MELIAEELVEKTWQDVAQFEPDRAQDEIVNMWQYQPDILTFVFTSTDDLTKDAQELAVYITFVVYRIFIETGAKVKKISAKDLMGTYRENIDLIQSLEGSSNRFLDGIAKKKYARQPFVMKYVVDALMEDAEHAGIDALSDDEKGMLFVLLKTVIDVLDQTG
jgi:hypothetical protein